MMMCGLFKFFRGSTKFAWLQLNRPACRRCQVSQSTSESVSQPLTSFKSFVPFFFLSYPAQCWWCDWLTDWYPLRRDERRQLSIGVWNNIKEGGTAGWRDQLSSGGFSLEPCWTDTFLMRVSRCGEISIRLVERYTWHFFIISRNYGKYLPYASRKQRKQL